MKKITFSILLTLTFCIAFAQAEYNYAIEFVSAAGSTETYNIVATATEAVPGTNTTKVDNFSLIVGWDAGVFDEPTFAPAGNGEFGSVGSYIATYVQSSNPAIGGVNAEDVWGVTYLSDGNTSTHPVGAFLIRQFTVTRLQAGSDPVILPVSNASVTFANTFGVGFSNSVIVNDGMDPSDERFNPAVIITPLGTELFDFNAITFTAYPNPTQGMVYVQNPSALNFDFEVVSITGKVVLPNGNLEARGENMIDLSALDEGVYFINIQSGNKDKKSLKIIVN